jgi:hypothetical protein
VKRDIRWFLIIVGLLLLIAPSAIRFFLYSSAPTTYTPPAIPTAAIAATPIPTITSVAVAELPAVPELPVRRGPVVVDLAHYSAINRDRFQLLASALAAQGVDLRFWLPTIALSSVKSFTEFPDQSEALQRILTDASALVVVSPFFLYSDKEVQVVEQFLADGGRLLVISDPDIESDAARDTNSLAAPFNVIFNEDYLYDTIDNDANYIHFFQAGFFDQAADLAGSRIGFYGGRSIDGAVTPQVRSAATTLSSLRIGQSEFTTVAIGGLHATNTVGRVLALSDFDVLTDPYVTRFDNRRMLDFVVGFLAGGERNQTIADFPAFFGKHVALIVESSEPVGAQTVSKAAEIQRALEFSGRSLALGATSWLTDSAAANEADLLYVARYVDAERSTTLLNDAGFALEERVITPTPPAARAAPAVTTPTPAASPPIASPESSPTPEEATPLPELPPVTPAPDLPLPTPALENTPLTLLKSPVLPPWRDVFAMQAPTPTPPGQTPAVETPAPVEEPTAALAGEDESGDEPTPTEEPLPESTVQPTATAEVQPTPTVQVYLARNDGMQLLAEETQLFIQRSEAGGRKIVAVLGASDAALNAGLTRLLNRDFIGCLIQDELVVCPFIAGASPATQMTPQNAVATPQRESDDAALIVIVDNNRDASEDEVSEAELYAALLARAGYSAELWSTRTDGYPALDDLRKFGWVIWSDAAYEQSGVRGEALQVIGGLINNGGKITISSRMPFFSVSGEPASPIADVVVADELPALVAGLPTDPIVLPEGLPAVVPLVRNPGEGADAVVAMRRGPASEAADAPVLTLFTDSDANEPQGAKLLLFTLSLTWLPDDVAAQLVKNMAQVMLEGS